VAAAAPVLHPRLLTPADLLPQRGPSPAAAPQPRVLQRPSPPPGDLPVPAADVASQASRTSSSGGDDRGAAGAAAPSAARGGGGDEAVAAAVAAQMGGVHKKFVGHVSLMYRELLKAVKAELGAAAQQQQAATAELVAAALEAQRKQVRLAVLAVSSRASSPEGAAT
jgi:hypothetical protein